VGYSSGLVLAEALAILPSLVWRYAHSFILRSHFMCFTRAQGVAKYGIGLGREGMGRVGVPAIIVSLRDPCAAYPPCSAIVGLVTGGSPPPAHASVEDLDAALDAFRVVAETAPAPDADATLAAALASGADADTDASITGCPVCTFIASPGAFSCEMCGTCMTPADFGSVSIFSDCVPFVYLGFESEHGYRACDGCILCLCLFLPVHPCPSLSIPVHPCPSLSIPVHPCPSLSIGVNPALALLHPQT
jgi:hypothetical protein